MPCKSDSEGQLHCLRRTEFNGGVKYAYRAATDIYARTVIWLRAKFRAITRSDNQDPHSERVKRETIQLT